MCAEASASDANVWAVINCLYTLVLNVTSEVFASLSNIAGGLVKLFELLGLIDVTGILSLWPESIRVQRTRIERPDSVFEGLYAGTVGALQVLGGSFFALGVIPTRRARDSGFTGFCMGALQGISSLTAAMAVTSFVLVTAIAAGFSSALRHRSAIAKTRPPRVFPPHLEVAPYSLHAAQAMSLLEGSTRKTLMPGMLQLTIAAFPLSRIRSPRPRMQQFTAEDRRAQVKDYLLVTADFVVCLRDGQAYWVCRREDIERCTVKVPAFLVGAFRAQQDLFLRHRERADGAAALAGTSPSLGNAQRSGNDQGSLYVVQIAIRNKLQLPEKVLLNFPLAYKAYVSHAAAKRSVVQALRKRLRLRGGSTEQGIPPSSPTANWTTVLPAAIPIPHGAIAGTLEQGSWSPLSQDGGINGGGHKGQSGALQDSMTVSRAVPPPAAGSDNGTLSFCQRLGTWLTCRRRWHFGSNARIQCNAGSLSLPPGRNWLGFRREASPSAPPEAVTLTISAPESVTALRIFDIICSISESERAASGTGGVPSVVQTSPSIGVKP